MKGPSREGLFLFFVDFLETLGEVSAFGRAGTLDDTVRIVDNHFMRHRKILVSASPPRYCRALH